MHFLYILYSHKIDKHYVGESPDMVNRLKQHNSHHFKGAFTKTASDWEIVLSFECGNRENALYLEKFVKRMKSRAFIEKIIKENEILADILRKNK
ncbi:GIY-YIG nuclease family protein [Maribacter sp. 2307ULW6-5]|uniref:GIY-YIG nuclease family protein n=1 Tax=Maribacter sp. 2307ULW6-5 TaxID=3386275 RepID=UPI0039BD87C2